MLATSGGGERKGSTEKTEPYRKEPWESLFKSRRKMV